MLYVFLVNLFIVAISVLVHYEFLYQLSRLVPKLPIKHRYRIVFGVFGALTAHTIEVWIFAIAYYLMHHTDGWGQLTGNLAGSVWDCSYFSFTVYTTLGLGDIHPVGDLRYLTGIESLTGLVLIAWSASFLYFEIQKDWGANQH